MPRRPAGQIYAVEERPPWAALLLLSAQHVLLMSSTLVLPVVLVSEIGGGFSEVQAVVALTMIACGLGSILQALRLGRVGAACLCPNLCGPNFFACSMEAAWLGGLPLMRGMILVSGLFEIVFAGQVRRLRALFPPEITGLVVLMVAESLIPLGVSKSLGINFPGEPILGRNLLVALLCLLVLVASNGFAQGRLKLYSVLIGMGLGYLFASAAGLLTPAEFHRVLVAPWLALPHPPDLCHLTFRMSLLPAFLIVAVTGALKSMGNLIMCQKINDEDWQTPDLAQIQRGLVADGLSVVGSALLGGMATDTSSSNVALCQASGASSRWIGVGAGSLFLLLAFSPKISALLSVMPTPVMGAILVFVTCFMIRSALQILLGAGLDVQRTFVVGIALVFGLSLDLAPELYAGVPAALRPLTSSSLTLAASLAVLLNQFMRLRWLGQPRPPAGPGATPR